MYEKKVKHIDGIYCPHHSSRNMQNMDINQQNFSKSNSSDIHANIYKLVVSPA